MRSRNKAKPIRRRAEYSVSDRAVRRDDPSGSIPGGGSGSGCCKLLCTHLLSAQQISGRK